MSKLPVLSGKEVCKALEAIGYRLDHQTGSHIILRNETPPYRRVTVPNHKEMAKVPSGQLFVRPASPSNYSWSSCRKSNPRAHPLATTSDTPRR